MITLPNVVSGDDGQFDNLHNLGSNLQYTYQMKNTQRSEIILERLPMRTMNIHTPLQYKGHGGQDPNALEFSYLNRNFFVNG